MAAAPQPYANHFSTAAQVCDVKRYTLAKSQCAALPSLTRIATRILDTLAEKLGPLLRSLAPETALRLHKNPPFACSQPSHKLMGGGGPPGACEVQFRTCLY